MRAKCSVCELHFCVPCSKISRELAHYILNSGDNLKWTCNSCKANFPTFSSLKSAIENLDEKNSQRLDSPEITVQNMDRNLRTRVNQEVNAMKVTVTSEIKQSVVDMVRTEIKTEIRENEERKSRLSNLVLFNMPESESENVEVRKQFDNENIQSLMSSLEINDYETRAVFRLGKQAPNKVRPIKMILEDKKFRKAILEKARSISTKVPPPLNKVVISKDLTPVQRAENKKKRMEKTQSKRTGGKSASNNKDINVASPMDINQNCQPNLIHTPDPRDALSQRSNILFHGTEILPSQLLLHGDRILYSLEEENETTMGVDLSQTLQYAEADGSLSSDV